MPPMIELLSDGHLQEPLRMLSTSPVVVNVPLALGNVLAQRTSLVARATGATEFPELTLTTELGVGLPEASIQWLTIDLPSVLPVDQLNVQTVEGSDATHAQIEVYEGESWRPLLPLTTFSLNAQVGLPPFPAQRLMLKFLREGGSPGLFVPARARVESVVVRVTPLPGGLELRAEDGELLFRHEPTMNADESIVVENFGDMVNESLERLGGPPAVFHLTAQIPGQVEITTQDLEVFAEGRAFSGGEETLELALPWEDEASAKVSIPNGGILRSLALDLRPDLAAEKLAFSPGAVVRGMSQLIDAEHHAAQRFDALDTGPLAGVELMLRAQSDAAGVVRLYPDDGGAPARVGFGGLEVPFDVPAGETWLALDLPKPVTLTGGAWWLVVEGTDGRMSWLCGSSVPAGAGPMLRRDADGPWLAPRPPIEAQIWGYTRLRMPDRSDKDIKVCFRRGNTLVDPVQKGSTWSAWEKMLTPLLAQNGPLEVVVSGDSAGTVALSCLRARYTV